MVPVSSEQHSHPLVDLLKVLGNSASVFVGDSRFLVGS